MTLADEVAAIDADRTDANAKMVTAYNSIRTNADAALNASTQGARNDAASAIVGSSAELWVQGLRLAALSANAQGRVMAAIISDMNRP